MAEQKVILNDPKEQNYFFEEAIKTSVLIYSLQAWM